LLKNILKYTYIILTSNFFNRYNKLKNLQTEDNYKYGNSKIFFRAGQVAYLERKRADRRKDCSIYIQKTWRRYICQKKYTQIRNSALLIQRYGRGVLDRR